ncbi:MAG: hypothetical protein KGL57_00230 [Burkholderiales bacterium]|nr:hypothetical protein [Burkholderiales bacterium]
MYRNFFLGMLVLVPFFAAGEDASAVSARLNAKRILEFVPEQCVAPEVMSPIAVRYVKDGDNVPSCGLLQKNGKYVDLISPEPGKSLPACAGPLKKPIYLYIGGAYLIYEYEVEDPKSEMTRTFQLFKMAGDEIDVCKNDDQLTDFAKMTIKNKGVAKSFGNALKRFGCIN